MQRRTSATKVAAWMKGECRSSSVPSVKMWNRARWPCTAVSCGRLQPDSPAPQQLL